MKLHSPGTKILDGEGASRPKLERSGKRQGSRPSVFLRVLLTLVLALGLLGSGIPAFADPIPDDAIHISTPEQLRALADAVNDPATNADTVGKYYVLDNDIDLGDYPNWTPIGTFTQVFNATFDGQGHTVSGMKISLAGYTYNTVGGLFGRAAGTIQNFTVEGTINSTLNNVNVFIGGAVGYAGGVEYENENYEPSPGNPYIAGKDALAIRNIKSQVDISANVGWIGGIVGYSDVGYYFSSEDPDWENDTAEVFDTTIEGCTSSGSLSSNSSTWIHMGGISGIALDANISGCYNTGAISITSKPASYCFVGGIAGQAVRASFSDSFNVGVISNPGGAVTLTYFGGVVGNVASLTITNCYYLDTSYSSDPSGATRKTATEIASPGFLTLINNGGNTFKVGTSHPLLSWETGGGTKDPEVVTPTIGTHPVAASYVVDEPAAALSVSANTTDDGALSYQWYKNTLNSSTGGTAIDGATDASYTPSTATVGTTYYYVIVTNTLDDKTAILTSNLAAITVALEDDGGSEEKVGDPGSGDLDGDGSATMGDVLTVARSVIFGDSTLTPAQLAAADMDGDGVLTMADVILILRKASGL